MGIPTLWPLNLRPLKVFFTQPVVSYVKCVCERIDSCRPRPCKPQALLMINCSLWSSEPPAVPFLFFPLPAFRALLQCHLLQEACHGLPSQEGSAPRSSGGLFPGPLPWLLKPHVPGGWAWHCFLCLCVSVLALSGETGHRWDGAQMPGDSYLQVLALSWSQLTTKVSKLAPGSKLACQPLSTLAPSRYHSHAPCQSFRLSPGS